MKTLLILGLFSGIGVYMLQPKDNGLTPFEFPEPLLFPKVPIDSINPVTVEGAELGRRLFYDPILSQDSSISCASCHQQEYAFGDNRMLSEGVNGKLTKRNTPPLFNLVWQKEFFWDGRAKGLEEQAFFPVSAEHEMNLNWKEAEHRINRSAYYPAEFEKVYGSEKIDSVLIAKAIVQFEKTLLSYNSKFDQALRGDTVLSEEEKRGFDIFDNLVKGNCIHCHNQDGNMLGSNFEYTNNGRFPAREPQHYPDPGRGLITGKAADYGKFKTPSLRNIAVTGPYMHDGYIETLEDVVDFYSDGLIKSINSDHRLFKIKEGGTRLAKEERKAIVSFLHTLTDSTFLTNPAYSNPWKDKEE